nr:hypothetical protein [Tanacetum cinerariifolium]
MTGNISYFSEYEPFIGGYVSFGHGRGKITGKGSIKTGKLEFENVYFMEELKYNLFNVSQICDNKIVFCSLILSALCWEKIASVDESMLWHRRLGHLNFKTMNKLVRSNLVEGLPSKSFENDHSCVACLKGKQHKASCKSKYGYYKNHKKSAKTKQKWTRERKEYTRAENLSSKVREGVIEGPEMIEVTNAKVAVATEKLKEARTHPLEEPSRAGSHLGNRGVYPDFLSSFPSMT